MGRKPHKFDPANAAKLDRPERQNIMPNEAVVGMLDLSGSETVVDYGAGSGVLSIPVARNLPEGIVYAVDESPAMIEHLQRRLAASRLTNVRPELIRDNALDLAPGSVHRVLAVRGGGRGRAAGDAARPEPGRLSARRRLAGGRRAGGRTPGRGLPLPEAAREILEEAGFDVTKVESVPFPYHFAYLVRRSAEDRP